MEVNGSGRLAQGRLPGKGRLIVAVFVCLIALIGAVGSQTFLGACIHEDGSFGACHWAAQAIFGLALLLAAQSLCVITAVLTAGKSFPKAARTSGICRGLFLAMALTCILAFFVPGSLIGLCSMETLRCRALMMPAMRILFTLSALLSVAGFFLAG
ncbi:MAG: DUF4418 family protein [Lachnospiraceae bacterium]|nr:DUF4418 family protein [Lachnospiraceae bacterium]